MNYEKAVSNIRSELKTYIKQNKIKSLILGVSGGMDSCLCAALAKPVCDELKIPLIGRSLPIATNGPDEIERAALTGKAFCTDFRQENLGEIFNQLSIINPQRFDSTLKNQKPYNKYDQPIIEDDKSWKIRNGNIKARLRMIYLYNLASMNKGMVLGTDNYTEYLLGFWSLHGDCGDFGMIQNLWKTEVYDMAEYLTKEEYSNKNRNAYEAIMFTIRAMATDGLGVTSKGDLGQIMPEFEGSSRDGYREVDNILRKYLLLNVVPQEKALKLHPVIQRHLDSNFKRNNPVNIDRNLIFE